MRIIWGVKPSPQKRGSSLGVKPCKHGVPETLLMHTRNQTGTPSGARGANHLVDHELANLQCKEETNTGLLPREQIYTVPEKEERKPVIHQCAMRGC